MDNNPELEESLFQALDAHDWYQWNVWDEEIWGPNPWGSAEWKCRRCGVITKDKIHVKANTRKDWKLNSCSYYVEAANRVRKVNGLQT